MAESVRLPVRTGISDPVVTNTPSAVQAAFIIVLASMERQTLRAPAKSARGSLIASGFPRLKESNFVQTDILLIAAIGKVINQAIAAAGRL